MFLVDAVWLCGVASTPSLEKQGFSWLTVISIEHGKLEHENLLDQHARVTHTTTLSDLSAVPLQCVTRLASSPCMVIPQATERILFLRWINCQIAKIVSFFKLWPSSPSDKSQWQFKLFDVAEKTCQFSQGRNTDAELHLSPNKCMLLTSLAPFKREKTGFLNEVYLHPLLQQRINQNTNFLSFCITLIGIDVKTQHFCWEEISRKVFIAYFFSPHMWKCCQEICQIGRRGCVHCVHRMYSQ